MKTWYRILLAAAALLAVTISVNAHAQGVVIGNRLIPESSIERPGDRGVRAHTLVQILIGPGGILGGKPDGGLGPAGGISPAQLRQAYNLPAGGGSQIIAIVDAYDNPNALSDFNTFAAEFGLPQETSTNVTASTNHVFQIVYGNGHKPGVDSSGGWELEEALDIEWAHAMAPNAKIILVEAGSNSFANLFNAEVTATNYTDGNGLQVKQVSNSWAGGEFSGETTYDSYFTSSAVSYFASSGDNGAPAEYPSASPYVVSVGGTTLNTDSNGNFTGETAWSGGGGGPSQYETRPLFQNSISAIVGSVRGTPDIASAADPNTGAAVYDSYPYSGSVLGWIPIGGTSWASPTMAGIANLAGTAYGAFPAGTQALLTLIYGNLGTANFLDITSGNNGYAAGVGWDFATGVGSCIGLAGLQPASAPLTTTSLSPTSATAGGTAFTLTVNGTGFVPGATINWSGTALTTTFVSNTQLTAAVPAADIAATGTANITVSNPGGTTSNALTFTIYPGPPTLTNMSPGAVNSGSAAFTLTVNGTAFVNGATINWNGSALTTTFVSSTQLKATVPAADIVTAGTASVTASSPGGATSNALTFTIYPPAITSLVPSSATAGGPAFSFVVRGSNFVSGATINWNGTPLTTTFTSSGQLNAMVPAADIVTAGTASITVSNPGGATSSPATFTINLPAITSLVPSSATAGGPAFSFVVRGSNFVSGATINWNGTPLTTTFTSSGQLNAMVPAADIATAGTASITVSNPGGATSSPATFTIKPHP